jgi:queuine tRNA-ribosyltransferase
LLQLPGHPITIESPALDYFPKKRLVPADTSPLPDASEFPYSAYSPRDFFKYEILHESKKSQARVGRIHTPHGIIDTPGYVAVATKSALKGVDFRDANQAGQQLIIFNTYHLMLYPESEIIRQSGGIHKRTNRNRP